MSWSELKNLWLKAPWTLQALIAVSIFDCSVAVVTRPVIGVPAVLLTLVTGYLLLKGFRWVWYLIVAYTAIWLVGYVLSSWPILSVEYLVALVLLLAPPTQRHFARPAKVEDHPSGSIDRPAKRRPVLAPREVSFWIVGFVVFAFAVGTILGHPLLGFLIAVVALSVALKIKRARTAGA